ncbi:MAG: hypothetical protein HKN57_05165 [Xanthomonadales bacterium]|nr:hypothetical protein [Gammaproteobacteria bacterium]MBT8052620.1 hypothetical protein [Gammaproteobacteria bacterium]NND56621.1 hypothetical protein [Xanthomonadales bacterium]NNK52437.1 hypothetical protein [Xanthomonadales bacterium]
MSRWFEGNPLAMVLASACGFLLLIAVVLGVLRSLPPSTPGTGGDGQSADLVLEVPQLGEAEPLDRYAVITERPVFNEGRQPQLEGLDEGEGEGDELAEEEVDAPELELAGVVITPSIRMVTLKSKDSSESLVAFEGKPLEGNYGTWQVSRIEPRQITLSSGAGEEKLLKLQVHDAKIAEPPKMEVAKDDEAEQSADAGDAQSDQPLSRAEEIRQRIAERREELRRAAEEKQDGEEKPQDYRSAIQSMIKSSRQKEQTDENDS